jgi:hypothetical protein
MAIQRARINICCAASQVIKCKVVTAARGLTMEPMAARDLLSSFRCGARLNHGANGPRFNTGSMARKTIHCC